jgi:hypothetical protein
MNLKDFSEIIKKNWLVILLLGCCVFLISRVVDFDVKVNKAKVKEISKIISAEPKNLPVEIKETDQDMVGITIYYPSGKSRRVIVTIEQRDEIIDRQYRDLPIDELLPKEEGF